MLKGFSPNLASIRKSQILQLQQKLTPRRQRCIMNLSGWLQLGLPVCSLNPFAWHAEIHYSSACFYCPFWNAKLILECSWKSLGFPTNPWLQHLPVASAAPIPLQLLVGPTKRSKRINAQRGEFHWCQIRTSPGWWRHKTQRIVGTSPTKNKKPAVEKLIFS